MQRHNGDERHADTDVLPFFSISGSSLAASYRHLSARQRTNRAFCHECRLLGLRLSVCQGCYKRRLLRITYDIRDQAFAGRRFRCQGTRYDGKLCLGSGVPVIQKSGRFARKEVEHARFLAQLSWPKP